MFYYSTATASFHAKFQLPYEITCSNTPSQPDPKVLIPPLHSGYILNSPITLCSTSGSYVLRKKLNCEGL
jgi:hypothetical protein